MQIRRKIYYDLATGNILQDCGEREGSVVETTQEQDFQSYVTLSERVPSTVGVIRLTYGQYADKFGVYDYHVDPVTETIIWDLTPIQQAEIVEQVTLESRIAGIETTQTEIIDTLATITGVEL